MKKGETRKFTTVTVTDSQTLIRPDGTTALLLETKEAGPIAFQIDLKAIEIIRRQLADAETVLRSAPGNA